MCHQHRFKDLLKQADNSNLILIFSFTCAVLLTHNIFALTFSHHVELLCFNKECLFMTSLCRLSVDRTVSTEV